MTRDETLELWERCETARKAARDAGGNRDCAHLAAKIVWDAWAQPLKLEYLSMLTEVKQVQRGAQSGIPDLPTDQVRQWKQRAGLQFNGFQFAMDADFRKFDFPSDVAFDELPVAGKWQSSTFESHADFRGAIFGGEARFVRTNFGEMTRFDGAKFNKGAIFDETNFSAPVIFSSSFLGNTRFDSVEFKSRVAFNGSIFEADAWFKGATFLGDTIFKGAEFRGSTDFSGIHAERTFSLRGVIFDQVPDFTQAHFAEAPDLDATKVHPLREESGDFWRSFGAAREVSPAQSHVASRFRALKRIAIQAHDSDLEQAFSAGELRGRRGVQDFGLPSLDNILRRKQVDEWQDDNGISHRGFIDVASFLPSPSSAQRMKYGPVWPGGLRFWMGGVYGIVSNFGRSIALPVFCRLLKFAAADKSQRI